MRVWRRGKESLFERASDLSVLADLLRISGQAWPAGLADYQLVDDGGQIVARFTAVTWTDDDEVGASLYRVEAGKLLRIDVSSGRRGDERKQSVELDGLEAAPDVPDPPPPQPAGAARLSRIPGAVGPHGHGAAFARAQELLAARVSAYDEALSERLLRALVALGWLNDSEPKLEAALGELVQGCRLAAFDRTAMDVKDPASEIATEYPISLHRFVSGLDGRERDEARALALTLAELAREVEREADDQEAVDAHNNAVCFYRAAKHLANAAAALEQVAT